MASQDDNSIVASPADCIPQGIWKIDDESYIITDDKMAVKSRVPNSMRNFIGTESLKAGTHVEKGEELGYSLFGRSDFVLVFHTFPSHSTIRLGNLKLHKKYHEDIITVQASIASA